MSKTRVHDYESDSSTVSWDQTLCIHMGECTRAKGELFNIGRKPWCDPSTAGAEEIEDVIERCPSGALTVRFAERGMVETPAAENTITVVYDGPLFVKGRLAIEGAPEDSPGLAFRAALCRCGLSKNKPFCDNSHRDSDWSDYGAVGETGSTLAETGGTLTIRPMENGPLKIRGNVTIVGASGRRAWQGNDTVLCRCGMSGNKPFCDGSHRREGWQSDQANG